MASTHPKSQTESIDHARDGDRPYLLTPPTRDLFIQTGKQIIDACQLGISVELWLQELGDMCDEVANWTKVNSRVRSCYCSPSGPRITFFFAPASQRFDFDLADELADLVLALHKFNVGMVELQQIPWGEMDRFLNVEIAKHISGEEHSPSGTVEA